MDEKKLEILERASHVYMKYGIKSVTMDDLARELGISKKTIYKYFEDKNDLVSTIIELKTEMDKAICMNYQQYAENAVDDLVNLIRLVVEHFNNVNPTVFYDLKKYHADAWEIMEKHKWSFVQSMIADNIRRGIEEGLYREGINAEIISKLYVSATDSIMDGGIFPWPEFKFQQVFSELIFFQLHGMVNDEGRKILNKIISNENKD
ncbi:MAG: TetR/AcrR family transcriptional regulator [Crocinitomicaceae bacterium]|nr:TetR/AcrR family transcriptional regulator [Crocinitomicaceae bacterium]